MDKDELIDGVWAECQGVTTPTDDLILTAARLAYLDAADMAAEQARSYGAINLDVTTERRAKDYICERTWLDAEQALRAKAAAVVAELEKK